MAQQVIHQHDRQHGFCDRHCANPHTRIVAPFGDHFDFFTRPVDRTSRHGNAGGRFQRHMRHNVLPATDATEDAASVVALKTLRRDFIAILAATQRHHVKSFADLHAFHRINAHQRMGDVRIQSVKYRFAKPCRHAARHHRHFRADGVTLFFQRAHQFVQRVKFVRIGAKERIKLNLTPVFNLQRNVAHLGQAAADFDAELFRQVFLGDRPCRYAHRGFTRGRTSTATVIAQAVFLLIGVIRVSRTKNIFNRAVVLRALIGVFNQQANAGAGRHAIKHAGENFYLIRFAALGSIARGAGAASVEIVLQIGLR
ncbi:Uncharacterised protein [Salmonella enterica subsp. enterica serovar Bovismorbificans]|uniref:Uncharacterized protein n=1 Tax=Salmonella enterica subsp. enterica serovar Bovismorbificans TaxID=58097 RepID=A0A655DN49_SALET|nr:Uncharacterised protein [Salmonella enterica subsp. enterica serovar Bovismorbificans]